MTFPQPSISVDSLDAFYKRQPALEKVSFSLSQGTVTAIVGPNGAGKSTLLKAMLGLLSTSQGNTRFLGESLQKVRGQIAYVPQRSEVDWDFPICVHDVVMMGRYQTLPFYKKPQQKDLSLVADALERVGMSTFKTRLIRELSGGQQQRVFLARALAQEAKIYILDEPFGGIDAPTEETLVRIFKELAQSGATVLCVHHDLATIKEYFSHVVLLNKKVISSGTIEDAFTVDAIKETYGGKLPFLSFGA